MPVMRPCQLSPLPHSLVVSRDTLRNDGSGDAFCVRVNPEAVVRRLQSMRLGGITIPSVGPDGLTEHGEDMVTAICKDLRWLELYKRLVETVNMKLYQRYDDDMNAAISAIRGMWLSFRSLRLSAGGRVSRGVCV